MIVIDTSAFVAILIKEPERAAFMAAIASTERRLVSAVTVLETRMVMHGRLGPSGVTDFNQLLDDIGAEIIAFDISQATAAYLAFATWGKGIHPAARLNFGDCISYALAKSLNVSLLFKGNDFAATDIKSAA